eukprot:Amastigsp_a511597_26.p4 type:complete len:116 gc:universal Amastigsp_a511597_26:1019-1366(+)
MVKNVGRRVFAASCVHTLRMNSELFVTKERGIMGNETSTSPWVPPYRRSHSGYAPVVILRKSTSSAFPRRIEAGGPGIGPLRGRLRSSASTTATSSPPTKSHLHDDSAHAHMEND